MVGSGVELDVPVEIVAPAFMKVVGRKASPVLLQLPAGRPERMPLDVHVRLARGSAALAQVARRAGGGDVLPGGSAALGARKDVIEGQFQHSATILAGETVAKEQVEPGEGGIFARADILAKRNHA